MRRGSGRGLLYKVRRPGCQTGDGAVLTTRTQDIVLVVYENEKGEAELAVRATRDAKGFTNKPHKRSVD